MARTEGARIKILNSNGDVVGSTNTIQFGDGFTVDTDGNIVTVDGDFPVAFAEEPSGAVNGVNTVFYIVNIPDYEEGVIVSIDGATQEWGVDYSVSIPDRKITFTAPPPNGTHIFAYYRGSLNEDSVPFGGLLTDGIPFLLDGHYLILA